MATHAMIDLETLAVSPNATILTIGAVKFNPYGNGYNDTFYCRVNIDEQDAMGRTVDPNTLDWWSKQDPAIMDEAFNPDNRLPVAEAIDQLHKFIWGCKGFWSHGSVFDIVILEDIYKQLGKNVPWNFWDIKDTRTIFDLGLDPDMPKNSKHDALQDAIRQSVGVQNIYRKLKIREH